MINTERANSPSIIRGIYFRPSSQQNNRNQQSSQQNEQQQQQVILPPSGKPPRQIPMDKIPKRNIQLQYLNNLNSNNNSSNRLITNETHNTEQSVRGRIGLPPLANLNDYKYNLNRLSRHLGNNSVHSQNSQRDQSNDSQTEIARPPYASRGKVKRNLSERGKVLNTSIETSQDEAPISARKSFNLKQTQSQNQEHNFVQQQLKQTVQARKILPSQLGSRQNSFDEKKQRQESYLKQLYCNEPLLPSQKTNPRDPDENSSTNLPPRETPPISALRRKTSLTRTPLNDITNLVQNSNLNQGNAQKDLPIWNANEKMKEFPPSVTSKCWVLYEMATGKYLEGKSPYNQRQVASLTKIMTFYTTLKIFESLQYSNYWDLQFRVTRYASSMNGTSAKLREGTWIKLGDLFYALMLPSGNDAAVVLAENMGYILQLQARYDQTSLHNLIRDRDSLYEGLMNSKAPIYAFLAEMNKNARILNMCLTNYANPHGLMNKENKSSAYDIGRLCCEAIKLSDFKKVVSTPTHSCRVELEGRYVEHSWENTNKLLGKQGWFGVKTGITDAAGPCLASCFTYTNPKTLQKKDYLVVLLNAKSMDIRWKESEDIVQWQIRQETGEKK